MNFFIYMVLNVICLLLYFIIIQARTINQLKDVIRGHQESIKMYRDMLREKGVEL